MDGPAFEILGQTVKLPVQVRDASAGTALYLADAHVARRLLPTEALDVVEVAPGRTLLSLGCIDYRDNDLGDYDEISVAFFVRERGGAGSSPLASLAGLLRGRAATWIHRLPVNQEFTCEAGRRIWGFPKTVDDLAIRAEGARCEATWSAGGRDVLRLSLPRGGRRELPERAMTTWTLRDGALHATQFTTAASGVGFRLGGAEIELGTHPIADELRALGLPRRALVTAWMEHMRGRFDAPRA